MSREKNRIATWSAIPSENRAKLTALLPLCTIDESTDPQIRLLTSWRTHWIFLIWNEQIKAILKLVILTLF